MIAGHTGSGKSTEALHHLSQRSIGDMPWIIYDFKGDHPVSACPVSGVLTLADDPPDEPGIYAVRAGWQDGEPGGAVERQLMRCMDRGHVGIYVDEGQRLGQRNAGLRTLLTAGRSRYCPLIFLTQRPIWVDTFAFSESEYLQFFDLPHPQDRDVIEQFVPRDKLDFDKLPEFHSYYYDVRKKSCEMLAPCPPPEQIFERITARLPRYEEEHLPRRVRL